MDLKKRKNYFKCKKCNIQFPSKFTYEIHREKKHKLHKYPVIPTEYVNVTVKKEYEDDVDEPSNSFDLERVNCENFVKDENEPSPSFVCAQCNNKFDDQRSYECHLLAHLENKTYACNLCNREFLSAVYLKRHNLLLHTNAAFWKYKCDYCDEKFATKWSLKNHVLKHTGEKPFACKHCEGKFTSKGLLLVHNLRKHTNPESWKHVCTLCGKKYPLAFDLKKHNATHEIIVEPTESDTYQCAYCFKIYKKKGNFENHQKSHLLDKEGEEKPPIPNQYTCFICGRSFKQRQGIKTHILLTHTSRDQWGYTCEICNEKFVTKQRLDDHRTATHTKEKPFNCDHCESKFRRANELKIHILLKHTDRSLWKYTCQFCNKKFAREPFLKSHLETHKDRPTQFCQECGNGFRSDKLLRLHVARKHTNPNNYEFECECRIKFATNQEFRKHQHVVNLGVGVKCEMCTVKFQCKLALKDHYMSVHSIAID